MKETQNEANTMGQEREEMIDTLMLLASKQLVILHRSMRLLQGRIVHLRYSSSLYVTRL